MNGVFLSTAGIAAAIIGSVVGAGFITGAEIARFFSSSAFVPSVITLFVLLVVFVWTMLDAGARYGSQKRANLCVLGHFSVIVDVAVPVFSFVSLMSMCAALDAVAGAIFGIDPRIPTLSAVVLPLSYLVCKRGVKGVERFNLLVVPLMLAVVAAASAGGGNLPQRGSILPVFVYAGMNAFLSSALIMGAGAESDPRSHFPAAVVVSAVVCLFVCLILKRISGVPAGEDLPLLHAVTSRPLRVSLYAASLVGIVTTLVASHYPLVLLTQKSPLKRTLNAILGTLAILFSRIGFNRIVGCLYPIIGVFGIAYCSVLTFSFFKSCFSRQSTFRQGTPARTFPRRGRGVSASKRKRDRA